MAAEAMCPICRRTHDNPGEDICKDCHRSYREIADTPDRLRNADVALWAARRAWEFADALLDMAPRRAPARASGDPGPSRSTGRRRRR